MDKSISMDELNSVCKKINELNDRMRSHDRNSRNLYEEIAWIWRNDRYITNIIEENHVSFRRNELQREGLIEEMKCKQASEIRKHEENMKRNNDKNNEREDA